MNTKIDIKSTLIGLLLGVLATVAIAAASSSGPSGRYQVAGAGNHAIIIDTATGQAWTTFQSPDGGRSDPGFYLPKNQ